jgi:hypothetical protein
MSKMNATIDGASDRTKLRHFTHASALLFTDALLVLLLLAGAFFLYQGLGVDFRVLDYRGPAAYGIPIGIALLVLAVLVAKFWLFAIEPETTSLRQSPPSLDRAPGSVPSAPMNE